MSKLQGKVRGDKEWSDIDTAWPQAELTAILQRMCDHGFKVIETDSLWRVVNPLTKQTECEYRLW